MALSEKEKRLFKILRDEKLNIIREKSQLEKRKIQWMPNSTESERASLDIERRKQFLKETLDAYVLSLIETLKQVKKNADEKDISELIETLKIIVNSEIDNFTSQYKNNIFSGIPDSVIDANIYVLENELPSFIPIALLPLNKFKIQSELTKEKTSLDNHTIALEIVRTAMISQLQTPINLAKHDEDTYRKIIGNALRIYYKGQVTLESLNSKGKTDILLKIKNKNILIVECKIWSKEKDFTDAIDQLLNRYLEWNDKKVLLVIFCRNESLTNVLNKIKKLAEQHNKYIQTLDSIEENEFGFLFSHPDDNNRDLILTVMVFKIPKNRKNYN